MAGPSNIRVNPFTGTGGVTNYVELTERHVVPVNSPYIVRLNEVPDKQDPSNIKMVYVDINGQTTGSVLTEVAATPGQGEFRMDYSTSAMEDKTWNTGLIEFSAADAGNQIEITYTGTGSLATVQSNRWPGFYTDYGDGSDGDFVPQSNVTISGTKNYKSVFIKSGVTVTVGFKTRIKCQGPFVNNGHLSADGYGSAGGLAVTGSDGTSKPGLAGVEGNIAAGGAGGNSKGNASAGGAGGYKYFTASLVDSYDTAFYGAGGGSGATSGHYNAGSEHSSGAGGAGGGEIFLVTKTLYNAGLISANGLKGGDSTYWEYNGGGGGGGGGRIVIICQQAIAKGTITASGGVGGTGGNVPIGSVGGATGENGLVIVKEIGAF